eukprot:15456501-Alexandrium_andersonii.AAC.1
MRRVLLASPSGVNAKSNQASMEGLRDRCRRWSPCAGAAARAAAARRTRPCAATPRPRPGGRPERTAAMGGRVGGGHTAL